MDSLQSIQQIKRMVASLSPTEAQALLSEIEVVNRYDAISAYKPYPKQALFHALGLTKRERLLRAGTQNGKSLCAGHEVAYHLTGMYPDWWAGKRFDGPITCWAAGETAEATRDNPQRVLLGNIEEFGTGAIPLRCLGSNATAAGTANLLDYQRVLHVPSGRWSLLRFKYYHQGRRKWQGPKVDLVWFDEEPPEDIYDEGMARTIACNGIGLMTFTPLLGMTNVVMRFLKEKNQDRADVCMTIWESDHIPLEEKHRRIASWPKHIRLARSEGVPTQGAGRVFTVDEEIIRWQSTAIPDHWARIAGMDFGWTHPTAAVWAAWDREADIVYVYDAYRVPEAKVAEHASAIRARGKWIPMAWPKDGLNETAVGPELAKQYRDEGINMLPTHAQYVKKEGEPEQSTVSVEAGNMDMLNRLQTGRLRVADHLNDWFEEYRLYHRDEDGKLVKEFDDLMSATRYMLMMLRFATVKPHGEAFKRPPPNWRTA